MAQADGVILALSLVQNLPLLVERPGDDDSGGVSGMLYGSVPGTCLIAGGFGAARFAVGDKLMVRAVWEGSVVGFWCEVLETTSQAGTLYYLSFPQHVEAIDFRKTDRMNVFIPAEVTITTSQDGRAEDHVLKGALLDLSEDGCCLSAQHFESDVVTCKLTFTLPGSSQIHTIEGKVVRKLGEGEAGTRLGVRFERDPRNIPEVSQVKEWVSSHISLT